MTNVHPGPISVVVPDDPVLEDTVNKRNILRSIRCGLDIEFQTVPESATFDGVLAWLHKSILHRSVEHAVAETWISDVCLHPPELASATAIDYPGLQVGKFSSDRLSDDTDLVFLVVSVAERPYAGGGDATPLQFVLRSGGGELIGRRVEGEIVELVVSESARRDDERGVSFACTD